MKDGDVSGHEMERIYREEGPRLWRAVYAYARDREIANDAVAESFARALKSSSEITRPVPWLWRVAFRIAAAELRQGRSSATEAQEGRYEMTAPSDSVLPVLGELAPKQRAAIVLHYYGGYSAKEIAGILGASPATIAVHMHRGRKALRKILENSDA
jgi:RNA polymerase sigma factor (sigma-70 family)